jgi:hypothetical protein
MVEILCPHCEEEIGLDDDAVGEFSCPYCHKEFEWTDDDELERIESLGRAKLTDDKANALVQSVDNRDAEQNYKFPLLVGNLRARWKVTIVGMIMWIVTHTIFWFLFIPIFAYDILHAEFMRIKYKREFSENILNPAYLRGTGLVVFPDLSAELVVKRRVPKYVFEKKDITRIVLHEESYYNAESNYELKIYLHGFHALTLYGFNKVDSKNIVSKLMSLYDIELRYTEHYNIPDFGIDGGGGGGG